MKTFLFFGGFATLFFLQVYGDVKMVGSPLPTKTQQTSNLPTSSPNSSWTVHSSTTDDKPVFKVPVHSNDVATNTHRNERSTLPKVQNILSGPEAFSSSPPKAKENHSLSKRFLKLHASYFRSLKPKADASQTDSNPIQLSSITGLPEKKFMKGVDAYLKILGKAKVGDAPAAEKKFMRGMDLYFKQGGRTDAGKSQSIDKRFLRWGDGYLQTARKLIQDDRLSPSLDKKFLNEDDSYMTEKAKFTLPTPSDLTWRNSWKGEQNIGLSPDKNVSQFGDSSSQAEENDYQETVNIPDKKFMRGFDAYLKATKQNAREEADSVREKKFLRGIGAYIQNKYQGPIRNGEYFAASIPEEKRFVKGIQIYLNRNLPSEIKRKGKYPLNDRLIESDGVDTIDENQGKFPDETISEYGSFRQRNANEDLTMSHNISSEKDTRFLKGANPYLQQRQSVDLEKRRMALSSDPTSSKDEEKRFLKGINLRILQHPVGSQLQQRVKRSEDEFLDESEQMYPLDKRFLKGANPYLRLSALYTPKRFMRIPFLMGNKASRDGFHADHDKRMDYEDDDLVDNDELESVDKRFTRGLNPYLRAFVISQNDKRFMRGINPYLQEFSTGNAHSKNSFPSLDKRFMKGINPYLQVYSFGRRGSSFDPNNAEDQVYSLNKRFLKGVNHYLQLYTNSLQDKRYGMGGMGGHNFRQKRFLRGMDPYLLFFMNHPQNKRFLGGENEEDIENEQPAVEKRFLRGGSHYLQEYLSGYPLKRENDFDPDTQKRFLKGVNPYLQTYSYGPRLKRDTHGNPEKRFIKNFEYYLNLYSRPENSDYHTERSHILPIVKRFVREPNQFLQTYLDTLKEKRFLKGWNPYLSYYTNSNNGGNKRIWENTDSNLATTRKQLLEGTNKYLQNQLQARANRQNNDGDDSADVQDEQSATVVSKTSHVSSPDAAAQEKGILKDSGQYVVSGKRSKRNAHVPSYSENSPQDFHSGLHDEKRFMRGVNPYLRTFSNLQRSARQQNQDTELIKSTAGSDGEVQDGHLNKKNDQTSLLDFPHFLRYQENGKEQFP